MMPPALVLGFGNVLLGDDGAGVRLVDHLRPNLAPRNYECIDGGTMSFALLSYVEAAHSMLVADAAELHAPPGTISIFEGAEMDAFLKSIRRRTVHEVGLIDLLDTARLLQRLPARRALLCIQPGPIAWGERLSPPVAAALAGAAAMAIAVLGRWHQE
jgi:hydrogenase maturation protease